jgi:hypothetical protein
MRRIAILKLPDSGPPIPVADGFIELTSGPEGLTIDNTRQRAYVHQDVGAITAIDLVSRQTSASWPTDCQSSHGIPALDEARGFLIAGCYSGRATVLDLDDNGRQLDTYQLPDGGATILNYSPSLRHFYMRGDPGSPLAILGVSSRGKLSFLGQLDSVPEPPRKGHCITSDDRGNVWVCDWNQGRVRRFADPYPATPADAP